VEALGYEVLAKPVYKFETRNPKQFQNGRKNEEISKQARFGFRNSDLAIVWDFGY
jgi:hypothetical protein